MFWLSDMPSLQFIFPGLNEALDSSGHPEDFDTVHVAGVRVGISV
jgi:hypothetical protein